MLQQNKLILFFLHERLLVSFTFNALDVPLMSCMGDWLCSERIKYQSSCNFGCWARAVFLAVIVSKAKLPCCPYLLDHVGLCSLLSFTIVIMAAVQARVAFVCTLTDRQMPHILFTYALGGVAFMRFLWVSFLRHLFLKIFYVCLHLGGHRARTNNIDM